MVRACSHCAPRSASSWPRLVGATPDRIALTELDDRRVQHRCVGTRASVPEDEVVTTDSEHPGLLLPLHVSGADVRVAEVAGRPTADALETIMSSVTPRTKLIALSHVLWTTGQVMPVHELKRESGLPCSSTVRSRWARSRSTSAISTTTRSPARSGSAAPSRSGRCTSRDPEGLDVAIPSYFAAEVDRDPTGRSSRRRVLGASTPAGSRRRRSRGFRQRSTGAPDWRHDRAAEIAGALSRSAARALRRGG